MWIAQPIHTLLKCCSGACLMALLLITETGHADMTTPKTISTQDRGEIHDLISRYSHAVDAGLKSEWLALFSENGQLNTPVGSPQGHTELRQWIEERLASREPQWQVRHFVVNTLIIPVTENRARARSMLLYSRQNIGQPLSAEILATGIYEDEVLRTEQGWRFVSRTMEVATPLDPAYMSDAK